VNIVRLLRRFMGKTRAVISGEKPNQILDWQEVREQLFPPDDDQPRALCLFARLLPQRTIFELEEISTKMCPHGFYQHGYCVHCSKGKHTVSARYERVLELFRPRLAFA
jgi:hypothetical protein